MVVVNQRVLGPKTSVEADNSEFGILFALLVYAKAAFTGKNTPRSGIQPASCLAISPTNLPAPPDRVLLRPKFSRSPLTGALLVYCEEAV
jgi:hypothetical protein